SADLVANGIVIGGRLIPIQTSPLSIPAQRGEFTFDNEYVPNPSRFNEISTTLLGVTLSSDAINAPLRAGLGLGFGILSGITAPKAKRAPKTITIEGESVYVLVTNQASEIPAQIQLKRDVNATSEEEL
ncbi:MAG: hypothetical protein HC810_02535, partial [Acaryochloridaceae cyanobacterium RL_2_7]|nr:hypothetical protein [Acaryochloridaceae cyanobacterium RL_2_7]